MVVSTSDSRIGRGFGGCGSLILLAVILIEARMALTREHGDLLNVLELSVALAVKASPEVGYKDLSSFVQPDPPAVKGRLIPEAWEAFRE